ncbi:MAG: alpha/beta hydrolase, partial [Pseudomonadota bacterium]
MVRGRGFARLAAKGAGFVVAGLVGLVVFAACQTPHTFAGFEPEVAPVPRFEIEDERFVTFDGAELGLTVWEAAEATLVDGEPEIVIVGLHGMNDYAHAFHMAAPYWAKRGVTTYAYDQRGFGRSAGRGEWPEEEDMREDLR